MEKQAPGELRAAAQPTRVQELLPALAARRAWLLPALPPTPASPGRIRALQQLCWEFPPEARPGGSRAAKALPGPEVRHRDVVTDPPPGAKEREEHERALPLQGKVLPKAPVNKNRVPGSRFPLSFS